LRWHRATQAATGFGQAYWNGWGTISSHFRQQEEPALSILRISIWRGMPGERLRGSSFIALGYPVFFDLIFSGFFRILAKILLEVIKWLAQLCTSLRQLLLQ
jgi:hypothetical protein